MTSDKKICVITGCSSGIGLHTALQICENPDFVVVATLRNPSQAPASLSKSTCDIQPLDVSNDTDVSKLVEYIRTTYGRCDVIVNNAGYGIPGSLEHVSILHAQNLFEVNVWGVMRMCQAFVPLMRLHQNGLIVTVSSISGVCGMPFMDLYTASKQAVEGLLESYRYSVERDNIKIMLINPGPTDTGFGDRFTQEVSLTHDNENPATQFSANLVVTRNKAGQPAHDCANVIVQTIIENVDKNIVNGVDAVPFWNATSDFSRSVINDVLRSPNGYDGIYAKRFQIARDAQSKSL